MGIPSKLIWVAALAAAGTVYVIFRKITAALDKSSIIKTIAGLRNNIEKAKEVAEALDIPYGKRENFSREDFSKLKSALQAAGKIGDFTLLYQTDVDDLRYLIIAEIQFSDFDITTSGKAEDVSKNAYHSFVLQFESDNQALSVWSDVFSDSNSKFQKQAFGNGITNSYPLSVVKE